MEKYKKIKKVIITIMTIIVCLYMDVVSMAEETWPAPFPATPAEEEGNKIVVIRSGTFYSMAATDSQYDFYVNVSNEMASTGPWRVYSTDFTTWTLGANKAAHASSSWAWIVDEMSETETAYSYSNTDIYTNNQLNEVFRPATQGKPQEETYYIMIGAIPHQLTVYESILVDTNWDYIRVVVMDGETQVYQETGAITDYSQPFSDGRLNIPLANMGLQDGHTYTFKVYGSVDGQVWLDAPHPYTMQTQFTFYQSEADEVRVMGIDDEKTYAYAPMVSWRKSGKYRNAKLRVVLNTNRIYEGTASNGYVNLAYLPAEYKDYLSIGKGGLNENTLTIIVEQPGDDYIVGSWNFWVNNDVTDMWTDNENQPLPGVIDWNSDESIIQQIKNTGKEAIEIVKIGFDFVPPGIMMLILLGFTLVIALRILGR